MNTATTKLIEILSLNWLTGPIFDKELRVSSRRKRNYVVRFVYLALLTTAAALFWAEMVRYNGPISYRISRMARAGMTITFIVIWFQFIATQIVAGVMLSTAISDEIYNKTLGTLMTTPISSFQIVTGKLLSKLLQTLMLIGLSFPLLSIIRIFGGIPWSYVVSSIAITIVTVIFVGSLSLFFSIFTRKAYVALILTILTLAVIFALIPFMVILGDVVGLYNVRERSFFAFFSYINPYIAMGMNTEAAFSSRSFIATVNRWIPNCLVMLAALGALLSVSFAFVRKVALRQATGQPDIFTPKAKSAGNEGSPHLTESSIRRVSNSPVLWKELRGPILGKRKKLLSISIGISILILIFTYLALASGNDLDHRDTHICYVLIFYSIGFLFTTILPATAITHEKESRSWHLLLATTLSNWDIVIAKFIGSIKRCLPAWGFLIAHLVIFTLFGFIHPLGILQVAIVSIGTSILLIGSGLFFSAIFKRTTTAVIMNFIFAAVIWGAIPFVLVMIYEIGRVRQVRHLSESYLNTIPFAQVVMSMESTANGFDKLRNPHWANGSKSPEASTIIMLKSSAVNTVIGIILILLAKSRFRKKIF
ncbi:MAG: ABC transporter permease subunit [Phycisphaerae bacterium]|nr:ABC transporter permease subunit [Phycisphaerae bacterium]